MQKAWIYQLNPKTSRGFLVRGGVVPTDTEGLFKVMREADKRSDGICDPWLVSKNYRVAKPGDPVLFQVRNDPAGENGGVALGWVFSVHIDGPRDAGLSFAFDLQASEYLRENPIPLEWIRHNVPLSQNNLRDATGQWRKIQRLLKSRDAYFEGITTLAKLADDPGVDVDGVVSRQALEAEGKRVLKTHLKLERSAKNRDLVLFSRDVPFKCDGCDLSMADTYGESFAELIHVHHLKPLGAKVNQTKPKLEDFALLCPNCHAIVHWKRATKPMTVKQLREAIAKSRRKGKAKGTAKKTKPTA